MALREHTQRRRGVESSFSTQGQSITQAVEWRVDRAALESALAAAVDVGVPIEAP